MSGNLRERMRAFYGGSTEYLALLEAHDERFLAPYVNAVLRFIPPPARALEIGGGNGAAARMLQQAGLNMVCAELSPLFLSKAAEWQNDRLAYAAADGLQLPFLDGGVRRGLLKRVYRTHGGRGRGAERNGARDGAGAGAF